MPHTVVIEGTSVTIGAQTRLPTLRKAMGIPDETTAFYRTNDVIRILHDADPVATQVPDGTVIEFHAGPIGPATELGVDDTRDADVDRDDDAGDDDGD
ncbi:hypothetical protein QA600_19750 [Natronococcus sp. A-GB1]|uniref:hypothetical protein n=1 Tax=Natronococcus sp. A-GB1 TaxID=3037648 RepID=UPI0024204427|nr:hypothetical protein [Natronococcus sp. A-GB1]MDG5761566.1 hypothetical protein [Natronococcus sp. A-GB1]